MPLPGQVFYYANYCKLIRPGELIIGIRRDGTARLGTWQDFKVLLILGSSSSGKTTTLVEKALGAARGGGLLVVCDPHGYKQDSLLRKIAPLQGALMPGTIFAIEHADIMHNVETVKRELDRRVRGGSCAVPIFLIIEELNRLQRDKAIANELKAVLQILGQEG
jgi:molybdopterin-guanine dinucleotide biosynthesis protein